jgi:hypothetical protein
MPFNQSYLETEHIPCQPLIGRRLSLEIKNLPMKNSFCPRVRNSEFTAFRPSYRTGRRQPDWHSTEKSQRPSKTEKSHAKPQSRKNLEPRGGEVGIAAEDRKDKKKRN